VIKLNLSKSDLGQGFRYSSFGLLSEEAFTFRHYSRVAKLEGLTAEASYGLQKVFSNRRFNYLHYSS
jgi:hypothetical protein